MKKLRVPLSNPAALRAGDEAVLSGTVYSARDQAHKRLVALLDAGRPLPVDLGGQVIYYTGPAPAPPGRVIGSAGPTTSGRMDAYTPRLLDAGLAGMIGKGYRSPAVVESMRRNGAVYFYAYGGCGALYAQCIRAARVIAFAELGPEALSRLEVEEFPVIVAIDAAGNSILA